MRRKKFEGEPDLTSYAGWTEFRHDCDPNRLAILADPTALVVVAFFRARVSATEFFPGKLSETTCENPAEFAAEIRRLVAFVQGEGQFLGLDPGPNPGTAAAWKALGLTPLLMATPTQPPPRPLLVPPEPAPTRPDPRPSTPNTADAKLSTTAQIVGVK